MSSPPVGHTLFSWTGDIGLDEQTPIGHTHFSWGLRGAGGCCQEDEGGGGGHGTSTQGGGNAPAVKKGFLADKAEPVGDIGDFLFNRVPEVFKKVEALHV